MPWCAANAVAIVCYSPLCRSLLAGRVPRGMTFDRKDIRSVDPKFQEPRFSQYMTAVERLTAFARERYGKTVLELAVRWVLDRPGISVALWGAKRPEQLDASAGVLGWTLDAAAMAEIDRIVQESVTDPVGPEYLTPRCERAEPESSARNRITAGTDRSPGQSHVDRWFVSKVGTRQPYSIFAFALDSCAPSIPRFYSGMDGDQQDFCLNNLRKRSKSAPAPAESAR